MLVFFALGNAKVLSFALGDAKVPNANDFASQWNIGLNSPRRFVVALGAPNAMDLVLGHFRYVLGPIKI